MSRQQPRSKAQASKPTHVTAPVSIPDKLYFRIGDVAQLCKLQAYVLRYWETEFPQLKPNKGGTGQRLYRKRDVELVLEIKRLLYSEGFTIAGARRLLAEKRRPEKTEEYLRAGSERMATSKPRDTPQSGTHKHTGTLRNSPTSAGPPAEPKVSVLASPSKPQLTELRREMRELLNLLGSDMPERSTVASRPKRATKRNNPSAEEPTLFS